MISFPKSILLICAVFSGLSCAPRTGPENNPSKIDAVENFALLDNTGKFQELYYYSDMKAVVLVAQQNGCPIMQKSYQYLEQLKKEYGALGVVFLMINANPDDDRDSINKEANAYNVDIPILEDRSQVITEALGFKRTAEALLIRPRDWSVVYRGAISDQFGYDSQVAGTVHNYLEEAIKAVLANKQVQVPHTDIKGCLFSFVAKNNNPPTYVKDIAPILINKCIVCHSPGQIGPWSMDNYEKVKDHAAMIREVIRVKRMPPWGADPFYGNLKDDNTLTPQEIRLIVHWAEQGMVRGDGEDPLLKVSRPPIDGWPLGKPDFIVSLKAKQSIPSVAAFNLRDIEGNKSLDQDAWVRQTYWKIGNRRAVHHGLLGLYPTATAHEDWFNMSGRTDQLDKIDASDGDHVIDAYTPGTPPLTLPDDLGMFLPKGTRFYFYMHYTSTGKAESDYTQVGFYFHKSRPSRILSVYDWGNKPDPTFLIPANIKDFKVTRVLHIKNNITLFAIKPHMHLRGRSMKIIVHYPDGSSRVILSVPHFRFIWQLRYWFKKPLVLPAGTDIELQASYDNSVQNLDNPDPNKAVTIGPYTENEMINAVLYYVRETL